MKVFEILNEEAFHTHTTEMPSYDDMMKDPEYHERAKNTISKKVMMEPSEYIATVARNLQTSRQSLLDGREEHLIKDYAEQMKSGGKPFPMLTLDYRDSKLEQEGLHRSFAAEIAGIEKVPVLIVRLKDESRGRIY